MRARSDLLTDSDVANCRDQYAIVETANISSSPISVPSVQTFPVIEESVTVHKTVADNGGVRLRKIVHADVIDIDEELTAQNVTLTRVPIDREVDGPVEVRYENGFTIIPVVEERLVIRRQLVLVEEIHLGRASHTRRAPQSITVRREEMIVERQSPGTDTWHADPSPAVPNIEPTSLKS